MNYLRNQIWGVNEPVPILDGRFVSYANLDNAASTPALRQVWETIQRFMCYYSSVHRGTGFKSRISTEAYEQARKIIARFVGADPQTNIVIFGKNATEAINKLSYRLKMLADAVVITTQLEHHSNDLPWRRRAEVVHVRATPEGRLDMDDFDRKLAEYADRVALVAVTGASNVTGVLPPIHRLAKKAHAVGAKILVDAAQLAAHRKIDILPDAHPEHIDFLAMSAHKMYAPFGTGALIAPRNALSDDAPEYCGGGVVKSVMLNDVDWADLPNREEAGSPNVVGAVAMAAAANWLMEIGLDNIATHEEELTAYALDKLSGIKGIKLYGLTSLKHIGDRVGVISFNLEGLNHALVAAILSYEGAIGVRNGCFCAHPYVIHLLGINEADNLAWRKQLRKDNKADLLGMVRISLGCYNETAEIDRLADMLERIALGEYDGKYRQNPETGQYLPVDDDEQIAEYFSLENSQPRFHAAPSVPAWATYDVPANRMKTAAAELTAHF